MSLHETETVRDPAGDSRRGPPRGAQIRDGVKSVVNLGICPESQWTYDIARFTEKPEQGCYEEALKNQAILYERIDQSLFQLKLALSEGLPFVFGFSVFESFESDAVSKTGDSPMPDPNEQMLGGHAVMAVGYDDATQRFLIRNSWGADWGKQGYFTLPYEYVTTSYYASDFWTLKLVETGT